MKILLADDHGLFRDSMSIWIQQLPEVTEVYFAETKDEVLEQLDTNFALILLDLNMPNMSGHLSITEFKKKSTTPILVVSSNKSPHVAQSCFDAGASGYICKLCSGQEILVVVTTVLAGKQYIPDLKACKGYAEIKSQLSAKQLKVLFLLGKGKTNQEIADELFLSIGTVKQYVSNVLETLKVTNRTQAGNIAHRILGYTEV